MLAAWTYGVLHVTDERSERLLQDFYWHTLKSYWPEERRFVETGYRSLPFAFAEVAPPSFAMREEWSLAQLIGYVRSWSATSRYAERHGVDPAAALEASLRPVWGDPEALQRVSWPLSMRIGVKP